jgi:hypothetical protein
MSTKIQQRKHSCKASVINFNNYVSVDQAQQLTVIELTFARPVKEEASATQIEKP